MDIQYISSPPLSVLSPSLVRQIFLPDTLLLLFLSNTNSSFSPRHIPLKPLPPLFFTNKLQVVTEYVHERLFYNILFFCFFLSSYLSFLPSPFLSFHQLYGIFLLSLFLSSYSSINFVLSFSLFLSSYPSIHSISYPSFPLSILVVPFVNNARSHHRSG